MDASAYRFRSRVRRVAELLDEHGHWRTDLVQSIFLPIDADVILKSKHPEDLMRTSLPGSQRNLGCLL
jgi:hypothetical protein